MTTAESRISGLEADREALARRIRAIERHLYGLGEEGEEDEATGNAAPDMAANALKTLQEMLSSDNKENPWLGVTASVALLQMERDDWKAKCEELERQAANLRKDSKPVLTSQWPKEE